MANAALVASMAEGGPHHRLAAMAGVWEGSYRLWFAPGPPTMQGTQRGRLRLALGGRFLVHEYSGEAGGDAFEGIALIGRHLDGGAWETAWVDSFHTGTSIMLQRSATTTGAAFTALGGYAAGDGPDWGWRTDIDQPDADTLRITMSNIEPGAEPQLAVQVDYVRVGKAAG